MPASSTNPMPTSGIAGGSSFRDDLRAAVETRRDLGPEYEDALVESFLEKIESTIAARVRAEVAAQAGHGPPGHYPPKKAADSAVGVALGSLGIGIPLTAIAAGNAGTVGLFLAWGGIIVVNMAYALSRRSQR